MPTHLRPFTHLHVASAWSLRHGADTPDTLAARAAELGQHTLALTDRDGLAGAVKHVLACQRHRLSPVLGVDLAVEPSGLLTGVRGRAAGSSGGQPPRITVLAHASGGGRDRLPDGAGWAALCRLVSATHARMSSGPASGSPASSSPASGSPVTTTALVAQHAGGSGSPAPAFTVLLGPMSEVGMAVLARRTDTARALLARWYDALPLGALALEVVCHGGPPGTPGSLGHAAHTLALARDAGLPAVLTNAVRYAAPGGARTADLLDATRLRLRLDSPRLARADGRAHLASSEEMAELADRIAVAAGAPRPGETGGADDLLAATAALADRCRLDGVDLGLGQVHLPEPEVLGLSAHTDADAVLRARCEAGIAVRYPGASSRRRAEVADRLSAELAVIAQMRYPTYFLTVAVVCDLVRAMGVRVAARGSGAGSLVTHLLGISGIEPLHHGLLMERFLTTERTDLPDIDIDVEAARRLDVYAAVLERFGGERVAAVAVADTYRVRQAVRDAGAALGMPAGEVDALAKAFPHLRARDARAALTDLPELRASGFTPARLEPLLDLVEHLDALPRHLALHPCGVLLSDATLLDRTPVQAAAGAPFPMSCFDKDDVEVMGLLKLDVLGVRMQSAMAHALGEIERTEGERVELDAVPHDDEATFRLIRSARTLGCFQIESPGQRELVGRFAPQDFTDLIIDISLFRPGPVKSDMVTPFLAGRQGWAPVNVLHESLRGVLASTCGVVVFHEQVIEIIAITAGVSLTQAETARRAMGSHAGQAEVAAWWRPLAAARGYTETDVARIWDVLAAFASFGFCKAHAAAFALPTYQSAWLKAHHPAAFLAGVLTHDPGMYPKRLILEEARTLGIVVLPIDVNASDETYRAQWVGGRGEIPRPELVAALPPRWSAAASGGADGAQGRAFAAGYRLDAGVPDARGWGIRLSLAEVKGITEEEVARIVAGAPYAGLADLWHRASPSRPIAERLVQVGALDAVAGIARAGADSGAPRRRGATTRRDLLLQVGDLERWTSAQGVPGRSKQRTSATGSSPQLAFDLGDAPDDVAATGLPEMTGGERVRVELEVLGLDASRHVTAPYDALCAALGTTRSTGLLTRRSRAEVLVAGVKVATQTPPIRSGRRVVFLTLDDATGLVDATFFEDAQGPWASTVFGSWLLLVRGELRRTGPRGVSLRATGAWDLPRLDDVWRRQGLTAVQALITGRTGVSTPPVLETRELEPFEREAPSRVLGAGRDDGALPGVDAGRSGVREHPDPRVAAAAARVEAGQEARRSGGMGGRRRVLLHASGFAQSPYADVATPGTDVRDTRALLGQLDQSQLEPAGPTALEPTAPEPAPEQQPELADPAEAPRKLWHTSPGSSGR